MRISSTPRRPSRKKGLPEAVTLKASAPPTHWPPTDAPTRPLNSTPMRSRPAEAVIFGDSSQEWLQASTLLSQKRPLSVKNCSRSFFSMAVFSRISVLSADHAAAASRKLSSAAAHPVLKALRGSQDLVIFRQRGVAFPLR